MQLRTEKVSPDVSGLGVDPEDTLEAGGDRLEFGSVSAVEVLVVLHPERQRGVTDRLPAAPPHAQHKVLSSAQHTQELNIVLFVGHLSRSVIGQSCKLLLVLIT